MGWRSGFASRVWTTGWEACATEAGGGGVLFLTMVCFYSPGYFHPLPEGHPFPMEKFPQAHGMLVRGGEGLVRVVEVGPCAREILELVHEPEYLDRIATGAMEPREITQLGLPPSAALLERSAREVEGTRQAAMAALEHEIAANLAGGTHHAFPDHGEGFCVLNDVAITIRDLFVRQPELRVFVADTDAHQGNGTHAIFREDARVFTYSIHVGRNYPSRKVPGSMDVELDRFASGAVFLERLRETLPGALDAFGSDLVFWISGADPHRNDRFGQLGLSAAEMCERDELVTRWVLERDIPLVVLYGGGYNREPGHTAGLHRNTIRAAARLARQFGL